MLQPGVVLSERYQLDDRLGRGAMGDVWRATDVLLGRTVAVKALLPALIADPGFSARFFAEARIMAALHHPGIVNVYDYGESHLAGGLTAVYLVMECVDGEPLSAHMEKLGRLSVAETLSIVSQAASALQAAHDAQIVHRDVKPGNLLLNREGSVLLADFGVARSGESAALTATNAVLGTARYMAPEQALGRPATPAADIYALGAVAYHCLAGVPPFQGETPIEVALHHVQDEPPPLPESISPRVRDLVSQAMAKDPADRFPSAAAFAAAADAIRAGVDDDTAAASSATALNLAAGLGSAAGTGMAMGATAASGSAAQASSAHGSGLAMGPGPAAGAASTAGLGSAGSDGGAPPPIRAAAAVPVPGDGPARAGDTAGDLIAVGPAPAKRHRTTKVAAAGAGLLLALLATFMLSDVGGDRPTGSVTPTVAPTDSGSNVEPTRRQPSGTRTTPAEAASTPTPEATQEPEPSVAPTPPAETTAPPPASTNSPPPPPATADASPGPVGAGGQPGPGQAVAPQDSSQTGSSAGPGQAGAEQIDSGQLGGPPPAPYNPLDPAVP